MKKFCHLVSTFFISLLVLCSLFAKLPTYAADSSVKPPVLEDVSINNESVTLDSEKSVKVNGGDAIRLAGTGASGDTIIITFNATEYKVPIPENGKWFVLFSAPIDIKSGKYKVEGQAVNKDGKKSEKPVLLTIDLTSLKDANSAKANSFANFFHNLFSKNNTYLLIIWALLFAVELTRLIIYIKRSKKIVHVKH